MTTPAGDEAELFWDRHYATRHTWGERVNPLLVETAEPAQTGPGEEEVLLGFLEYLRGAIAGKAADAPEPQVRIGGVPSGTNVLGLVKHLAFGRTRSSTPAGT